MCYYYYSHLTGEETEVQSFNNLFQVPRLISVEPGLAAWLFLYHLYFPTVTADRVETSKKATERAQWELTHL